MRLRHTGRCLKHRIARQLKVAALPCHAFTTSPTNGNARVHRPPRRAGLQPPPNLRRNGQGGLEELLSF